MNTAEIGTSPSSRDVITDFVHLQDKIDLHSIDASPAPLSQHFSNVVQSNSVIAGAVSWYVSSGVTIVQGDTDGKTQTAEFRLELTGALKSHGGRLYPLADKGVPFGDTRSASFEGVRCPLRNWAASLLLSADVRLDCSRPKDAYRRNSRV